MKKEKAFEGMDLLRIHEESGELATLQLNAAETLAKQQDYRNGYVLLVYSLEEAAKSTICMTYNSFRGQATGVGGDGVPLEQHILESHVSSMFKYHEAKHKTILVQAVFQLLNTFDHDLKKRVNFAIRNQDLKNSPELFALLKVFKNLDKKRLGACYVDKTTKNITDYKKEYEELLPYVKSALNRLNQFAVRKFDRYSETEKNIVALLEKV